MHNLSFLSFFFSFCEGNLLSEKSTEGNYKSTLTMEDEELSFSPVTISPASDIDAGPIDHVLVISEGENKNAKVSGKFNSYSKFQIINTLLLDRNVPCTDDNYEKYP